MKGDILYNSPASNTSILNLGMNRSTINVKSNTTLVTDIKARLKCSCLREIIEKYITDIRLRMGLSNWHVHPFRADILKHVRSSRKLLPNMLKLGTFQNR